MHRLGEISVRDYSNCESPVPLEKGVWRGQRKKTWVEKAASQMIKASGAGEMGYGWNGGWGTIVWIHFLSLLTSWWSLSHPEPDGEKLASIMNQVSWMEKCGMWMKRGRHTWMKLSFLQDVGFCQASLWYLPDLHDVKSSRNSYVAACYMENCLC
jgi:hypothetical protein